MFSIVVTYALHFLKIVTVKKFPLKSIFDVKVQYQTEISSELRDFKEQSPTWLVRGTARRLLRRQLYGLLGR
jgi:hypothetical protein